MIYDARQTIRNTIDMIFVEKGITPTCHKNNREQMGALVATCYMRMDS